MKEELLTDQGDKVLKRTKGLVLGFLSDGILLNLFWVAGCQILFWRNFMVPLNETIINLPEL